MAQENSLKQTPLTYHEQAMHDIRCGHIHFTHLLIFPIFHFFFSSSDQRVDLHCCIRVRKYVIEEMDIAGRSEKMEKQPGKIT